MTETTEATTDPQTLALLRNDVRGLSKAQIGDLVATLTERAGIDPALAPIDLITDKQTGAIRVYFNARGAAELAKRRDLSDDDLDIDIRESVVIAKLTMTDPQTGRRRTDVGAAAFKADWADSLANAIKKASTSAHRRVTMGMVGIFIDEPLVDPEGMMRDWADAPFVRVYSTLSRDHPKVWSDLATLGGYVRMLMAADLAWPGLADVPRAVEPEVLAALAAEGVVELVGDQYRFHGLEAERAGRRLGNRIGGRVRALTADRDEHGRFLPSDAGDAGRSELDDEPATAGVAGPGPAAGRASLDPLDRPSTNGAKPLDERRWTTSDPAFQTDSQTAEPSRARTSGSVTTRERASAPAREASPTSIRCRDYVAHRSEHRFWTGIGWRCQVCEREDAEAEAMRLETFTTKVEKAAARAALDDDDRPF